MHEDFKCPKCGIYGKQDGPIQEDKDGCTASWFMYCEECNWQWDVVVGDPVVINQGRM